MPRLSKRGWQLKQLMNLMQQLLDLIKLEEAIYGFKMHTSSPTKLQKMEHYLPASPLNLTALSTSEFPSKLPSYY